MKKILVIIIGILTLCFCKLNVAEASEMKRLSFPDKNNFSQAYLQENFWKLNYDNAGKDLSYFVIVPKSVKPVKIDPTPVMGSKLIAIGSYATVETAELYLEINAYYERLDGLVQPSEWLNKTLKIVDQEIINQREITTAQGNKYADILSKKSNVITRTTEYVNGKGGYIALSVSCDEQDYEKLSDVIQHIVSSWRLK
jgi:hypothetical protein